MRPIHRRHVLQLASLSGLALGARSARARQDEPKASTRAGSDRERVLAAGMDEAEADCWERVTRAAGALLELPAAGEEHGQVHAIHALQEHLLARPTYRRYLEAAGAGGRGRGAWKELEAFAEPVDLERAAAAGLTPAESECWAALAECAGSFAALPSLHPMADHELAHAFHALRDVLLARATDRRYRGEPR